MKNLAKIFVVLTLLLIAGKVWAINIRASYPDGSVYDVPENTPGAIISRLQGLDIVSDKTPAGLISLLQQNYNELSNYRASGNYLGNDTRASITSDMAVMQQAIQQIQATQFDPTSPANSFTVDQNGNLSSKALPPCDDWIPGACAFLEAVSTLLGWIVSFLGWIVTYTASKLFNFSIDLSVRNFAPLIGKSAGVKAAWAVIRDLVNIAFIFTLLYVAIGTILQLNSVNGKNLLKNVIIAALLVNFSFFFTGIVIDASNVVANSLYDKAASGQLNGTTPDIVTPLIARMNFDDNGLSDPNLQQDISPSGQIKAIVIQQIGQIVLMIITCTILLAGAVMFFTRTIVLTFVLVFSPIAFLGMATGGALKELVSKWQKALTSQLIFAPAYLLCIFLTIQIVKTTNSAATIAGGAGLLATLVLYVIINGLMLGSLMVAKNLSVAGAALGTKLGGGITGYGTKILTRTATGGIAGAARGLYGGGLKQVLTGKDAEGNKVGIGGRFRGLGSTLTTGVVSGVAGGARTGAKAGVEAVRTGGTFVKAVTTAVKRPDEALNEAVAAGTGIKILGQTRDDEKERKKREKEEKEETDRQKSKDNQDKAKKIAGQIKNGTIKEGSPEEEVAKKDLAQMAEKDVVELDPKTMATLAHLFSNAQVAAIMKKSDMTQKEKDDVETNRAVPFARELERATIGAISAGGTFASNSAVQKALRLMNPDRLGKFISTLDKSNPNYNNQLQMIAKNINKGWVNEMTKNGSLDFDVATRIELMV